MSAYYLYKLSNRLMLFGNKLTVTLNLVEVAILKFYFAAAAACGHTARIKT